MTIMRHICTVQNCVGHQNPYDPYFNLFMASANSESIKDGMDRVAKLFPQRIVVMPGDQDESSLEKALLENLACDLERFS